MINILVGKFVLEANENVPKPCDLENVELKFGKDMFDVLQLGDYINDKTLNLIPSISANANSSGVMKRSAFEYIEKRLLDTIEQNLRDLDGIYLHLHGASYVEDIGSGDHHILRKVRQLVGPYLPIGIACDPHGNLTKEYVENATIIRSYRESPHTDVEETNRFVFSKLIELIQHPKNITPVYKKLPMILGGEQSVSSDEPVKSFNVLLNKEEEDERILSCSWHVGYIRHDCPEAGCGIVVVPNGNSNYEYANEVADKLATYIVSKRHEFHYTGLTLQPEQALQKALSQEDSPVFLTDSGDNVTSGSTGSNTFVLRQVLNEKVPDKKILFASIHDANTCHKLLNMNIGETVSINLGADYDELSKPIDLDVKVLYKGRQVGTKMFGENGDYGACVTVQIVDSNIEIIITDTNHPFVEMEQYQAAGLNYNDFDLIVVKLGYAFPELVENGKLCIMSLTQGATLQDTSKLPFKLIMRPMYPIDEI